MYEPQENLVEIAMERHIAFRNSVLCHKIFGIWPDDDQFLARFSKAKGYGIAAVTLGICGFHFLSLMIDNTTHISEIAIEITASLAASAKVVPIVLKRNSILNLLLMTKEYYSSLDVCVREKMIINYWQNIQDNIINVCNKSYSAVLIIYLCAPLFKDKAFPLQGILPDGVTESPWFEITYAIETLLSLLRFVGVLSSDAFSITFMCQLCCRLQLTKYSMENLRKGDKKYLLRAVERHSTALEYGCMICNNFSIIFLLQYVLISILLCLAGLTILHTDNTFVIMKMLLMAVVAIITMLIMCSVGETVTGSSLEIADIIQCNAYIAFLKDKTLLKLTNFILFRAQIPLRLSMGTYSTMNLRFFSESMNKVVSFFMILKTLME